MNTLKIGTSGLLAGLLLVTTASPAQAQGTIVYHNPPDIPVFSTDVIPTRHDLDLNGDGTTDFTFEAFDSFQIFSRTGNRSIGVSTPGELSSPSIPLQSGFLIGATLSEPLEWITTKTVTSLPDYWIGAWLHARAFSGSAGYWDPPWPEYLRAYVGVAFAIEESLHYGWIQVEVFAAPGNGGTLLDWAYNSVPGQPILAGQVPEPSTWALWLVGAGLLGWRTWRSSPKV